MFPLASPPPLQLIYMNLNHGRTRGDKKQGAIGNILGNALRTWGTL